MSKATNANKRKREDQSVSTLRYDWQFLVSKVIQVGSACKAVTSNPQVQHDLNNRCHEFIESCDKLKKTVGKMESVVRGKEEEMRGLTLAKMSTGVVGKRRRRKPKPEQLDEKFTMRTGTGTSTSSAVNVDVANVAIPLPVMGVPPGLPLPAPEQDDVIIIS